MVYRPECLVFVFVFVFVFVLCSGLPSRVPGQCLLVVLVYNIIEPPTQVIKSERFFLRIQNVLLVSFWKLVAKIIYGSLKNLLFGTIVPNVGGVGWTQTFINHSLYGIFDPFFAISGIRERMLKFCFRS